MKIYSGREILARMPSQQRGDPAGSRFFCLPGRFHAIAEAHRFPEGTGGGAGVLFVLQDHSPEEIVPDHPGGVYRDGPVLRKPLRPHKGFPPLTGTPRNPFSTGGKQVVCTGISRCLHFVRIPIH